MKKLTFLLFLSIIGIISQSCGGDDNVDDVKPIIDTEIQGAFPTNCVTISKGSNLNFKVRFTDNKELGSFNIDIHHNFDHHSHSTSSEQCQLDPIKTAINPWTFIQNYSIPENSDDYTATGSIAIPSNVDTGDYHFMYKVTDASGWQTLNGLTLKIID